MSREYLPLKNCSLSGKIFCKAPAKLALLVLIALLFILLSACTVDKVEPEPEIDAHAPLPYGHFVWLMMKQLDPDLIFSEPVPEAMQLAAEHGYIPSFQDPQAPITREESAAILMHMKQLPGPWDPAHYTWQILDLADADCRYRSDLMAAYAQGLLVTENGRIQPKDYLYLDEARSILARLEHPDQRTLPPNQPAPYFEYKGLVELNALDPSIIIDLKYATTDNFTGVVHYERPLCLLEAETAQRLVAANRSFQKDGYTIKIWDGYRPVQVQWSLYNATPEHLKAYVPAPSRYSQHAKGIAVDITLVDEHLQEIAMPTDFDDFSEKAHPDNPDVSPAAGINRDFLITGMQPYGFQVSRLEWWHFYQPAKTSLPVSTVELDEFIAARDRFYMETIDDAVR